MDKFEEYVKVLNETFLALSEMVLVEHKTIQYQCRVPIELFEQTIDILDAKRKQDLDAIVKCLGDIYETNPYLRPTMDSINKLKQEKKVMSTNQFINIIYAHLIKNEVDEKNRIDLGVLCGELACSRNTVRAILKRVKEKVSEGWKIQPIVSTWLIQEEHFYNTGI